MAIAALATSEPRSTETRAPFMAFIRDADSARVIRRALPEIAAAPDAIASGDIRTATKHLRQRRSPELLFVDISGQAQPLPLVQELSEVCEPGVHVIVVGDCENLGLYRDLLQCGVADYIVKPLTFELVHQAVDIALHPEARTPVSQKMGKVVAVLGTRGGVGATTIAVGLASSLAEGAGRRVVLIDANLQTGDCGLMLDLHETSALREALEDSARVDKNYLDRAMARCGERLFVMSGVEPLDRELQLPAEGMEKLVKALRPDFHYIVIDIPRIPSALTRRAIELAGLRILVSDTSVRSVREVVRWQELLTQAPSSHRNLLVLNRLGQGGEDEIPEREFLAAVQMEAAVTIRQKGVGGGLFALGRRSGNTLKEGIASLTAELTGIRSRQSKWRLPWQ